MDRADHTKTAGERFMTITARVSPDGGELTIQVTGRFDFSAHQEFRKAYEIGVKPKRFSIDMSNATYLDSSALGMLLLLRDHAGGDSADIHIVNCNEDIKGILTVSNFDQLFTIA
jgi:HptB-dependent secretion and biofilm anti anti-sigma factor